MLLTQRRTCGIWQSRKPVAGGARVTQTGKTAGNLRGRSVTLRQGRRAAGRASGVGGVSDVARNRSSNALLLLLLFPIFARRFSLGRRPEDVGAKWSVSEEGHRARVVFGTNTAATLPLLGPSVSFGPTSPGPQRRSGGALANTLLQQPDHFTQDFSVSTVGRN